MRLSRSLTVSILTLVCAGCEEEPRQPVAASKPAATAKNAVDAIPTPSVSAPPRAFLDEKKEIDSGLEWNREVISRNGGAISFRVESQGLFALTLINGKAYQALKAGSQAPLNQSDVLFTADSQGTTCEGKVTLPAGSSYFIVENRASKIVEFHLQCFPGT